MKLKLLLLSAIALQMQRIACSKPLAEGTENALWTANLITTSTVVERLVKTRIEETVCNREVRSQEAVLTVVVQSEAYITSFNAKSLKSGVQIRSVILANGESAKKYQTHRNEGLTTGIVYSRDRGIFVLRLNVAANDTAVFSLSYEEIISRRLGVVGQVIKLTQQPSVQKVTVHVDIRLLKSETVKGIRLSHENDTKIRTTNDTVSLIYSESPTQQDNYNLTFTYDYSVSETPSSGLVHFQGDYFIHYLAPDWLTPISKSVVFVVDTSGSMSGYKMAATKSALKNILRTTLSHTDLFNILTFDDDVTAWKQALALTNEENISKAKLHVENITPRGSTDINNALVSAFQLLHNSSTHTSSVQYLPMVVFLTDGEPTSGVLNFIELRKNVKEANRGLSLLICLGFGDDANMKLLTQLSYENGGTALHILEGDSSVSDFETAVRGVSVPLMRNVVVSYTRVMYTSSVEFPSFFRGSEIVVVGRMLDGNHDYKLEFTIDYNKSTSRRHSSQFSARYVQQNSLTEGDLQRLYANKRCQELYREFLVADEKDSHQIWDALLNISLSYGLVTPATSMVLVRRNRIVTTPTVAYNSSNDIQYIEDGDISDQHEIIVVGGPPLRHGGRFASGQLAANTDSHRVNSNAVYVGVGMFVVMCSAIAVGIAIRRRRHRKFHRMAMLRFRAKGDNTNANSPSGGLLLDT